MNVCWIPEPSVLIVSEASYFRKQTLGSTKYTSMFYIQNKSSLLKTKALIAIKNFADRLKYVMNINCSITGLCMSPLNYT